MSSSGAATVEPCASTTKPTTITSRPAASSSQLASEKRSDPCESAGVAPDRVERVVRGMRKASSDRVLSQARNLLAKRTGSSKAPVEHSRAEVAAQLRTLAVERGGVLLVHTSFRAVRPVEGGPLGLIGALRDALGPDGTLVMPAWSCSDDEPFDPATTPASRDLGVVADKFWRLPGARRSDHPFAFAAEGPHAEQITSDPLPLPPHIPESPVGRVHQLDGQVLLLGIGHDVNTTLHLAEVLASVPYRVPKHCTILQDGRPVRIEYGENDHCGARFALAEGWLESRGLQARAQVGNAPARLARSRDIVALALEHLAADPLLFLHPPDAGCAECDAARASIRG
jgi:aminoglycoside N3'-acetyltransferase